MSVQAQDRRTVNTPTFVITVNAEFDECVKASTCGEYVGDMYGDEGIRLLSHIILALGGEDGESSDSDMLINILPSGLYVRLRPSLSHLWDLLLWVCLTFRRPVPGNVCLSTSKIDGGKVTLQELSQLEGPESTSCWLSLFETAVIASDPRIQSQAGFFLELNFGLMLQLAAVEYPVMVDSGLVLMGYSTALVPIKEVDHQAILWHLETAAHDSQLKTMELTAVRGEWMRKTELKDLQSSRVFLGWCSEAMILLGTGRLNSTIQWSNAKPKSTTWSLTGINLQLLATTVSPFQFGGSLGLTFERVVTTLPFDTNDGYLECLKSSIVEQVILYDVSESRAWLVPLITVLHQMLLEYCGRIPAEFRKGTIPRAKPPYTGAESSFRSLEGSSSLVVEGSGKDRLTVRDLILGFSANVAKVGLHPAGRSKIYGYEFMDIVTGSPRSELKETSIDKEASAWSSLLSHVKCLFCSQLGDVIVGRKSEDKQLPCNRLPVGLDWLAASMCSLDTLNTRQGGNPTGIMRLLSSEHYWSMTGSPFQDCHHSNARYAYARSKHLKHSPNNFFLFPRVPVSEMIVKRRAVQPIHGSVLLFLCNKLGAFDHIWI
ncbi:hypothetical protein BDV39DRAFT_198186 [Aspergillus sergii]|uniref:Uncharacterized protein n=1 Tax=Aspergillus sergii TaxID=1034303 RepID=A0A5N6WJD7_9EURO|nr:hypothetical protein BDV39DRAFT_198186 [Aspergillus sergii]